VGGNDGGVSSLGMGGTPSMGSAATGQAVAGGHAGHDARHCEPLDCYAMCRLADQEQQKSCAEINRQHEERMKAMGCPGMRCRTSKITKGCRKRKAPAKKCSCKEKSCSCEH